MLQIIPVINNKGGVGKTTTAVNLAAGLARLGKRVLLVDLDGQGSASLSLGVERQEPGSAAALYGQVPLIGTIRPTHVPNLFVSPGTLALASVDVRLAGLPKRVERLRQVLEPAREEYDVILLDCSPSASLLTVNTLVAADALIIPLTPDFLAVQGLLSFGDLVRNVRKAIGRVAPVLGLALTNADPESDSTAAVSDALRQRYGGKVFNTLIRPDDALRSAPIHGQDIFAYAPGSTGATDYAALAREVAGRIERYSVIFSKPKPAPVTTEQAQAVERAGKLQTSR